MANNNKKRKLFDRFRLSLGFAGIDASTDDSLICPLCWQETPYAFLTLEHVVPGSVGGKAEALTCKNCNNGRIGGNVDAHLSQFQSIKDRFKGQGRLRAQLSVKGHRVAADIEWGNGYKNIEIIGEASNPAMIAAIHDEITAGNVDELNLTLPFGYSKSKFKIAVVRSAYLTVFKWLGYEWARQEIVQTIRRRIHDPSLEQPRLDSLIIGINDFAPPRDAHHFIAPGNVNGVGFLLAIIRVRKATTTYVGAYLPQSDDRADEFFSLMEQVQREHDGRKLSIAAADLIM